MKKFVILSDITCDLSKEIRDFIGLEDYITGYVEINGKSLSTTLNWDNISREEFYKILANAKNKVSSAAPNIEDYYNKFKAYVEAGYAVISISISSKISGTYNVSLLGRDKVLEEYPDAKIHCIDSLRMSGSLGLLVLYACMLKNEGKTYEEVSEWLETNKHRVHQMGPIDDLTFVARRGQISKGKAFMGNLVGIKPMGDSNREGYVTILAKAKGIKKALKITVEYVKAIATNLENQYLIISHTYREEIAKDLKQLLLSEIKCKDVLISDVFSGCGTNIGPGMVGVYFLGNPITEDLETERTTIKDIMTNLK